MMNRQNPLMIGAARPSGMKPIFENFNNMPNVGENVYVPSNITGKYEYLKCVLIKQDNSLISQEVIVYHVFFASPEEKDNDKVDIQSGIRYYTIRTYGRNINKESM